MRYSRIKRIFTVDLICDSPSYKRLFFSFAMGNIADGMTFIMIPLIAAHLTSSPSDIGWVLFFRTLPLLITIIPCGIILDRFNRARVVAFANLTRFIFTLGFLLSFGGPFSGSMGFIYCVSFVLGVAEVFYDLGATSLIPQTVPKRDLARVNGVFQVLEVALGVLLGGLIVSLLFSVSPEVAVIGTALSYALSFVFLRGLEIAENPDKELFSLKAEMIQGFSIIWGSRELLTFSLIGGINNLLFYAILSTLVLYIKSELGYSDMIFTIINSAPGLGIIVAGLSISSILSRLSPIPSYYFGICLFSLGLILFSFFKSFFLMGLAFFIIGFSWVICGTISKLYRQVFFSKNLHGKVNAFSRLITAGTMPLGSLFGAFLVKDQGYQSAYFLIVSCSLLPVILFGIVSRQIQFSKEEFCE